MLSCVRREELKEKLREKLELERRALKVVERLLEDSVSEDFLVDCVCSADFLTCFIRVFKFKCCFMFMFFLYLHVLVVNFCVLLCETFLKAAVFKFYLVKVIF